ncbi:ABC transporter ATP-binding protein [Paracoccus sp. P2]|mgnify:CR=1 FL=1|uniref:ABC transporter ATP-binding protein n=1 Tax=Paracoccus pantotrophus TaxID=82367 RepID=A0A7H9BUG7_PARPN|nr:ABC transporter ATP-binding protein [Paracoccus pantotrophus]MDF3856243.1 ABC transporter ATP-binding protein [Paracoccus pantotrophus]QLH14987.1 ABC transporter ATP-binding protein [Paracoccus pantotrophus]RDD96509.1 ABC transporter ATP-binding protein [Paracoccus pantotrophus]RNI15543.1 ABC transporter ATP-binding protein [Paracoccus pantotrophus]WGR65370.1 ABC transporter ATP-binding protein [Paracoccus pantotrophus]
MSNVFRAEGLGKTYPGVRANDDVSFAVEAGEIHALLGENGAGKSTLVKMIYGLVRPDEGRMALLGAPYAPHDPRAARAAGVAMVFQHFSLFDALTVAENIALGMENPPPRAELSRRIAELSQSYGLPLNPARRIASLSAGERQRVEILRCLLQSPRLLIMDEPTSVLTPQEAEILFATLRQLAGAGTAILYISHKLEEIRSHCDRATILRQGKLVGTVDPRAHSARELAAMMVGAEMRLVDRSGRKPAAPVLEVRGLSTVGGEGMALKDVALSLRSGEILGIGGVAGNGQEELLSALSGETATAPGTIALEGRDLSRAGPEARRRAGLLAAPEDRLGHAAVPEFSLAENTLLTAGARQGLIRKGLIDRKAATVFAQQVIRAFDVRTPGPDTAAGALSGGNLQKFVIGREVLGRPRVLVVNQPTWGVDAGAAAAIRQALLDLAAQGAGLIVISQDLDELLELSDRFCALNQGRLSAPRPTEGLTVEEIGLMLGGAHGMEVAHVPA